MSRTRPKMDVFGSAKTDNVLAVLTGGTTPQRAATEPGFSEADKAHLEAKIQDLTTELTKQQGVIFIPFDQISRNPLNPRVIFPQPEVQAFAEVLKEQGQLEPGAVLKLTDEIRSQLREYATQGLFDPRQPGFNDNAPYLLFNGERRWRSGPLAKLSGFMTVILPATIAIDLLDMQAKAAATSIFQKKLHPLEIAQFLITQITYHYPDLATQFEDPAIVVYPRILNSLLVKLQREDKRSGGKRLNELNSLATASREDQLQHLSTIEGETEQAIVSVLFRHQLKPSTVNRHIFPLLKLPDDLKQVIYTAGVEIDKVEELKKLNAKALNLPESSAIAVRTQVSNQAIAEQWDKQTIVKQVSDILARHRNETNPTTGADLPKPFTNLEKLDFNSLKADQLRTCEQILEQRLRDVRGLLSNLLSSKQ